MTINQYHKIFYIEDDKKINDPTTLQLKLFYKDVKNFYNAQSAVEEIKNGNIPDILITDICLPEINGIEFSSIVKEKNPNVYILFTTAHNNTNYYKSAIDLNVVKYFLKPYNVKDLIEELTKLSKKIDEEKLAKILLNSQKSLSLIKDKKTSEIVYMNQKLLDYLGFNSLESFKKCRKPIDDYIVKNDKNLFFKELTDYSKWIDAIEYLPVEKRLVTFDINKISETFHVTIEEQDNFQIVNFYDVTETIRKQLYFKDKAMKDTLTQIYNREFFNHNFKNIYDEFQKLRLHTAIILIDVDNFKSINDKYGHIIGDKVLKDMVNILQNNSRERDYLIRWGGEEFLLLIPLKDQKNLEKTIEKFRVSIEKTPFEIIGKLTCSFGATICKNYDDVNDAIKRADIALYKSKKNGKNQLSVNY